MQERRSPTLLYEQCETKLNDTMTTLIYSNNALITFSNYFLILQKSSIKFHSFTKIFRKMLLFMQFILYMQYLFKMNHEFVWLYESSSCIIKVYTKVDVALCGLIA